MKRDFRQRKIKVMPKEQRELLRKLASMKITEQDRVLMSIKR